MANYTSAVVRTASLNALLDQTEFSNPIARTTGLRARKVVTNQLQADVKSYQVVAARSKSSNDYTSGAYTTGAPPNHHALSKLIFSRTERRLQAAQLSTARTSRDDYGFMLPNPNSSPEQLAIFRAVYECPMTVTNADLAKIINMELSTIISPPTPIGAHFYIRSWTFTAKELREICSQMGEYEEVLEWKKVLALHAPRDMTLESELDEDLEDISTINAQDPATLPSTIREALESQSTTTEEVEQRARTQGTNGEVYFTPRYIGVTTGPLRPIDRYLADLRRKKYGILTEFMEVVERLCPAVADAAEVHLLTDASLGVGDHSRDVAGVLNKYNKEDRERFLIEYFDHSTSLNRQHGGYFSQYIPREEDMDLFTSLGVKFYHRLITRSGVTPPQLYSDITQHFEKVQHWANANSGTTGTSRNVYSDELRQATTQQAQPMQYRSASTIIAILGKDITMDNYLHARPFFGGESQAAELTADNIHRLAGVEDINYTTKSFNPAAFPFVDLWNWLVHVDIDWVCELLRIYFTICRPLIMVSLGREVNELTRGNFLHRLGVPSQSFLPCLGDLTVQFYNKGPGQISDEMAFINVPHYHPGADKYTARQVELRRMFDLNWQVTWIVGDVLLTLIDKYGANLPSRKALCEEAVAIVKTDKKYAGFWQNFNEAKQELQSVIGATGPNEDVRPVLNKEGRSRMAALGQAEHKPESDERRAQLEVWWEKNIPDLHLVVDHSDAKREAWIEEFMPLAEGQFFFPQVLNKLPPDQYTNHLLRAIQPLWLEDTSWMNETEKREAAILRCGMWFHRQKKDSERIKTWYPDDYASASEMHGRLVGVGTTGAIRLQWKKDDGTKYVVQIRVKLAIPPAGQPHATRSIFFTRHGIDIRAADGSAFRTYIAKTDTTAKASIPRNLLAGTEGAFNVEAGGQVTLDLWRAVRIARGKSVPDDGTQDAKVWTCVKGIAGIARNATTEKPRQNRPPVEGDAIFPLQVWLVERFPNGGILRTISATKLADSTEDLQHLVAFLRSPHWINYPHVLDWFLPNLEREGGGGPDIALLEKNIRILRATKKVRNSHGGPGSGRNPTVETIIEVGPPGSASNDPFPAKEKKAAPAKKRKAGVDDEEDDDLVLDDEDDDGETPAASKSKKKVSAAPKGKKRKQEDEDDYAPEPEQKKKKGKRKGKASEDVDDGGGEAPELGSKPKRRNARVPGVPDPKPRSGGSRKKQVVLEDDDEDEEMADDAEVEEPKKSSGRKKAVPRKKKV